MRHRSFYLLALASGLALIDATSSCLDIKDKDACSQSNDASTDEACVWCVCSAIPSECVSASMAKKLPPAVFNCDAPRDVPMPLKSLFQPDSKSVSISSVLEQAPAIFSHWKDVHSKQYESLSEELNRFSNFKRTLLDVATHNLADDQTFWLELNRFADMSWEEFSSSRLGAIGDEQSCSATRKGESNVALRSNAIIPLSVDWREKGAVSFVKDQGHCGSCWTFSTTGCLESHHFLKTGEMVILSEQQLIDCAQEFDNQGCNGGLPSHAFEYIHSVGGLDTEAAYPYLASDSSCSFLKDKVGATVRASKNITFQDEKELEEAVGTVGPVAIAFQVTSDFKSYSGGVYNNPACGTSPDQVNHAVLAVGYGTDPEAGDYWIIKNSWGSDWGEEGYFKMARGKNMCGIADCASYPLV